MRPGEQRESTSQHYTYNDTTVTYIRTILTAHTMHTCVVIHVQIYCMYAVTYVRVYSVNSTYVHTQNLICMYIVCIMQVIARFSEKSSQLLYN